MVCRMEQLGQYLTALVFRPIRSRYCVLHPEKLIMVYLILFDCQGRPSGLLNHCNLQQLTTCNFRKLIRSRELVSNSQSSVYENKIHEHWAMVDMPIQVQLWGEWFLRKSEPPKIRKFRSQNWKSWIILAKFRLIPICRVIFWVYPIFRVIFFSLNWELQKSEFSQVSSHYRLEVGMCPKNQSKFRFSKEFPNGEVPEAKIGENLISEGVFK